MDVSDINKVANRKRVNSEIESLREKVRNETGKIIKLKVSQDTAYWDLREKLQLLENNHAKLQQNMVELQMQYEALSSKYQEELRLRPETLNKFSGTREISDVLENYCERLKETLARCKADQVTLCEAYEKSGEMVMDIESKQIQLNERNKQTIHRLTEKVKLTSDHQSQLLQFFTAAKQQSDAELNTLKADLTTAQMQKNELFVAVNDLSRNLEQCKHEIEKKDGVISTMQKDMKHIVQEFNNKDNAMKNNVVKLEKDLKEVTESNESLKKALANQEAFSKMICEQKDTLQDKLVGAENELSTTAYKVKDLEAKYENVSINNNKLNEEIKMLINRNKELKVIIMDKDQGLNNYEEEIHKLKSAITAEVAQKSEMILALNTAMNDAEIKKTSIVEMAAVQEALEKKIAEMENDLTTLKETSEEEIKELKNIIADNKKEITSKSSAIAQLMSDIKSGTDTQAKLEVTLQKLKKELEVERGIGKEKEEKYMRRVEQLKNMNQNKEEELSNQTKIISELISEKERLQGKIQDKQNVIDNIQKELTGRNITVQNAHDPPEQDDNAVMLTPSIKRPSESTTTYRKVQKTSTMAVPRNADNEIDELIFSIFSDNSAEGESSIDKSEVNRLFNAMQRGERLSPVSLSAFKRKSGVRDFQGGLGPQTTTNNEPISLSQLRNDGKNKGRTFFKTKRSDKKKKK